MRALVTGGAGFIGSHLVEALLQRGDDVRIVDCFTDCYEPARKRDNLAAVADSVELIEADLLDADLPALLDGIDVVFHQAGQPGVRLSWSDGFPAYDARNVLATQRLLEGCRDHPLRRFVFAASSSVYGEAERYPTDELDLPKPRSPYGITKLAAEHLCSLYASMWGVPTVSLRYFTVFGPRQRPDMAFYRLCEALLTGTPFPQFGNGSQIRDFTYVDDVVAANLAAAADESQAPPGAVINVAGGGSVSLREVIAMIEEIAGEPVPIEQHLVQSGDVSRTGGSIERARTMLGWSPQVDLREGLARQLEWHRTHRFGAPVAARARSQGE
jgi:UDP-glucuronate 4-epimerase